MSKKNKGAILLAAAAGLGLAIVAVYVFAPSLALKAIYEGYQLRSGVSERSATLPDGETVSYFEGGVRGAPVLVLVHGFGDSRNSFVQSARWMSDGHHLILPEMRGFGDSPRDPSRKHSIRAQVERLDAFLSAPGVLPDPSRPVVLVGNSMGGHVSAAYALAHPERVRALVLLSPAGLRVDDPVPYHDVERAIESEADFDAYMDKLFFKKPWIPAPFRADFIAKSKEGFAWLQRIRGEIRGGEDYVLNDRIRAIRAPTLIVWGEHDGIVRPVHAALWNRDIPGSRLIRLEDAGHSPQYEMPERTARLILEFLEGLPRAA